MPSISLPSAAAVGAVASVAGAGISALGMIEGGEAQSREAAYNAQVARNNQTIAEQKAQYATEAGQEKAAEQSLDNANKEGALRAAIAANGVDVNSGSAEDVQTSQREVDKLDTLTTLNNSMLEAYGYRTQGTNYGAQAGLDTTESQQASLAGDIGAFGSLASNAGSVGFKWYQINNPPKYDINDFTAPTAG